MEQWEQEGSVVDVLAVENVLVRILLSLVSSEFIGGQDFMGKQTLLALGFKEMLVISQSGFSQSCSLLKGVDFLDLFVKKLFKRHIFCVLL